MGEIVKRYKKGNKTICYITKYCTAYVVSTGKPSDASCISWRYPNLTQAEYTAQEYYNNYMGVLR